MIFNTIPKIVEYLFTGGLFNPELADHVRVRDLLMDAHAELVTAREEIEHFNTLFKKAHLCPLCGKSDFGPEDTHMMTKHGTNCPKD